MLFVIKVHDHEFQDMNMLNFIKFELVSTILHCPFDYNTDICSTYILSSFVQSVLRVLEWLNIILLHPIFVVVSDPILNIPAYSKNDHQQLCLQSNFLNATYFTLPFSLLQTDYKLGSFAAPQLQLLTLPSSSS